MLAWALRFILLFAALAMTMAWPGHVATAGILGATAIVVAGFMAVLAGILLLAYAIAQANAGERPAGVQALSVAGIAGEYAALVLFYVVIQPFERFWMGSDAVGGLKPGAVPVLLVHGYMCNRGYWWWFRARLRERGHAVATITLETPITGIEELADSLDRRITELLAETGAEKVALVTHSMGGLVARAMMRRHGEARIARFITLAGPHDGTALARLGIGLNGRQMRIGSQWLAELNAAPPPRVPTFSIWSPGDEIIAPQASSHLCWARELVLPALGHLAFALSRQVLDAVAADLET